MARGRNNRSGGSSGSKAKNTKFRGSNVPSSSSSSSGGARSMEEHLAAIDHHWNSLTPKSKTFLLEHKSIETLTFGKLIEFWTQPDQVYYAQMAVSVGTCHLLAYEYYHVGAYDNAAILALNGAFLQQCMNTSTIDDIKTWPPEKINRENLPHYHSARMVLSKGKECISRYLTSVLPLRYQNMLQLEGHASHVPGMGYVDLISDDWGTTSHGSSGKHRRPDGDTDEVEIKIVLSNQENGTEHEKTIKPSTALKSVFNAYAEECGESLRSLRFYYNGSMLFISSLGQKTAKDLGLTNSDTISVSSNNSKKTQEQPTQKSEPKKKNKPASKKLHQAKGKAKSQPQIIAVPQTEKELKEAHSLLLSKVHEEAEPKLKMIRQRLNDLVLNCQGPKNRRASSKKKDVSENAAVFNPNTYGLGGKAGKTSYAINVGRVENLYLSSKRNSFQSRSSMSTRSSFVDLHGCNRDQAIELLDKSFVDWMDTAMKGDHPWVIPATIVCGGGSQILSETVEAWIKGNKNVANAPRGSWLVQ